MSNTNKIILAAAVFFLLSGTGLVIYQKFLENHAVRTVQTAEITEALRRLDEAEEYLRQNSADAARQAVVIFNRIRSLNLSKPINQRATYGLALALEKIDDQAAALEHYRSLKQDQIDDPDLRDRVDYSLGKLLLYINHEEEGRSLLETLLARTLDDDKGRRLKSRIHNAFGNYYLRRGDRRRATENFAVALKYYPENIQAERGRADAVRGSGRAAAAYEYYDDFLTGNSRLDPGSREHVNRQVRQDMYSSGVRAYRRQQYQDAIFYFRKLLGQYPDSPDSEKAMYWLGESYLATGRDDLAMNAFKDTLENNDTEMDQASLIKRGMILFRQGKVEQAASEFQKASTNYPGGSYTERALEWQRECESQLRDRTQLEEYMNRDQRNNAQPAPVQESPPRQN